MYKQIKGLLIYKINKYNTESFFNYYCLLWTHIANRIMNVVLYVINYVETFDVFGWIVY